MSKFLNWLSSLVASAVVRGFENGVKQVFTDLDEQSPEAEVAKISLGGIFGKPALPLRESIPQAEVSMVKPEKIKRKPGRPKQQPSETVPAQEPKKRGRPRKSL